MKVIVYVRFKILNRRFVFYVRKVAKVVGVNSLLADGLHVPLIDCDVIALPLLREEVQRLLTRFGLGRATIVSTGRENSFHVYIWERLPFRKCIEIVASCRYTDLKHLHFSIRRGYFTLRVSKKTHRDVSAVCSIGREELMPVSYKDFENFSLYETASKI